jgi:UDP-N-acetyl-D-galactosamine dehydrogenase
MIAAVAHAEYRRLGGVKIAAKLVPGGCFVDVKSAFDRDALRAAELCVWRL